MKRAFSWIVCNTYYYLTLFELFTDQTYHKFVYNVRVEYFHSMGATNVNLQRLVGNFNLRKTLVDKNDVCLGKFTFV